MGTSTSFATLRTNYVVWVVAHVIIAGFTVEGFSQDIWAEYREKYVGKVFSDEWEFVEKVGSLYYLDGRIKDVHPKRVVFLHCYDTIKGLNIFTVFREICDSSLECDHEHELVDVLAFDAGDYLGNRPGFVRFDALCYLDTLAPGIEEAICTDTVVIAVIENRLGRGRIPQISDDIVKMWILEPHKLRFEEFNHDHVYYLLGGFGNFYIDQGVHIERR